MKLLRFFFFVLSAVALFSCEGSYSKLDNLLESEFVGKVKTSYEGNNIIVVFQEMKNLLNVSPIELDYYVSRVATVAIDYVGRTNFIGFSQLRVDIAPLQRSYIYPTDITVKALEKLPVIAEVQVLLNQEEDIELLKNFDDIITAEMFEEQVLKEWNDLKQWNNKDVTPKYIGFKLLQLPGEEEYFIRIGGRVENKQGEFALVEFMFTDVSKKIISITITYL